MRNAYNRMVETAGDPAASRADLLAALADVERTRRELDALEKALIEAARARSTPWAAVARALGLASRQAAEQRWLRLRAATATGSRDAARGQRDVDVEAVVPLRRAVVALRVRMASEGEWDGRHPRAALARQTLEHAAEAQVGAMMTLVAQVIDDLDAMGPAGRRAMAKQIAALREEFDRCAQRRSD
ncbi:MAG: hypothetical protein HOV79_25690 [Hamadaea sp.]|nr:hypothetical protein [Hamadaea sp.]